VNERQVVDRTVFWMDTKLDLGYSTQIASVTLKIDNCYGRPWVSPHSSDLIHTEWPLVHF